MRMLTLKGGPNAGKEIDLDFICTGRDGDCPVHPRISHGNAATGPCLEQHDYDMETGIYMGNRVDRWIDCETHGVCKMRDYMCEGCWFASTSPEQRMFQKAHKMGREYGRRQAALTMHGFHNGVTSQSEFELVEKIAKALEENVG